LLKERRDSLNKEADPMTTATADPEVAPSATQDDRAGSPAIEIPVADFDIAIHNVVVTAFNPATGQHRTFKVG
jgi:hypothetical protein